ncbi:arylsulfatase [Streptomyces sp. NPDC048361]|uniref:arylsulfatase n=1 Tax=Streptomyces sp. NPDC048361 TaxID=3154720 RepID=UPI003434BC58
MTTLALLHTSPVHVPVFDALRDDEAPGIQLRHLVHAQLLDRARESGPDAVAGGVRTVLADAVARGAGAVLCTCSTIGAVAEAEAASLGVPVLRVDRPMAAAAVAAGPRIVVVAALASTLEPTAALIREEARAREDACAREDARAREGARAIAGARAREEARACEGARAGEEACAREVVGVRSLDLRMVLADDAWAHFESGDMDAYAAAIVRTVDALRHVDVVVLAQASMAPAAARAAIGVPVLASPRLGLRAAAASVGRLTRWVG